MQDFLQLEHHISSLIKLSISRTTLFENVAWIPGSTYTCPIPSSSWFQPPYYFLTFSPKNIVLVTIFPFFAYIMIKGWFLWQTAYLIQNTKTWRNGSFWHFVVDTQQHKFCSSWKTFHYFFSIKFENTS